MLAAVKLLAHARKQRQLRRAHELESGRQRVAREQDIVPRGVVCADERCLALLWTILEPGDQAGGVARRVQHAKVPDAPCPVVHAALGIQARLIADEADEGHRAVPKHAEEEGRQRKQNPTIPVDHLVLLRAKRDVRANARLCRPRLNVCRLHGDLLIPHPDRPWECPQRHAGMHGGRTGPRDGEHEGCQHLGRPMAALLTRFSAEAADLVLVLSRE